MNTMRVHSLIPCLLALTTAACATSGAVPRPFPSPDWDLPAPASASAPEDGDAADTPGVPPAADAPETPEAPVSALDDAAESGPGRNSLTSRRFDGRAVAQFAMGFRGVPYRLGGSDPAGFDCSGLVQYVFAQYGITVPRVVEEQYHVGHTIKPLDIKPGDLIFFNTKGPGASHVGISIGNEQFVHAPNSTGVVRVESLSSSYWGSRYMSARRVTTSTAHK
jgi:cell wall-associated NlpC family hydrolase